jgi:predicted DNA repair protein MutK
MAAKKTAGVLGDDLALNAQQVSGVRAEREIPVVWAVAKGSFLNKLILVPSALAISAFVPWLVTPLLMVGGAYLCFEGFEKLAHKFLHSKTEDDADHAQLSAAVAEPTTDLVAYEKDKIKGAIRTDFILSAEIIAITLGTVAGASLTQQVIVMSGIAIVMTVGVYGLVAGIVKLDDLGLWLTQKSASAAKSIGNAILRAAPYMMKGLSAIGTAAMFLVGGGILTHGIPVLHHWIESVGAAAGSAGFVVPVLLNGVAGIIAGAVVLLAVSLVGKLCKAVRA